TEQRPLPASAASDSRTITLESAADAAPSTDPDRLLVRRCRLRAKSAAGCTAFGGARRNGGVQAANQGTRIAADAAAPPRRAPAPLRVGNANRSGRGPLLGNGPDRRAARRASRSHLAARPWPRGARSER